MTNFVIEITTALLRGELSCHFFLKIAAKIRKTKGMRFPNKSNCSIQNSVKIKLYFFILQLIACL